MGHKLNIVGNMPVYENPNIVTFTTAELAAIDRPQTDISDLYPYAHSATPGEYYSQMQVQWEAKDIAASSRNDFGVFIEPEASNYNNNFLFNVQIGLFAFDTDGEELGAFAFFGRTKNSTVESSKATIGNNTEDYIILPANVSQDSHSGAKATLNLSVNTQVFARVQEDSASYNYVAGFSIINVGSVAALSTVVGNISLTKHIQEETVFLPTK